MTTITATDKPYPDFPLWAHASGQWAKRIKGKIFYFGVVADPKKALAKYLDERDGRQAGLVPRKKEQALTLRVLVNRFLNSKRMQVESGELSARTWHDYHQAAETMIDQFGKDRAVLDLRPEDFDGFRAKLAKSLGPVSVSNAILRTRVVLKWAHDNDLIDRPVRFGTGFRRPTAKVLRKAKKRSGARTFEADELRRIIGAAKQPLKAMILLGLNCGFGATDLAAMPRGAIDLKTGWIDYPRVKTAIDRRVPLWPETMAALNEVLADRPDPAADSDADLVFLTRLGKRWVRFREKKVINADGDEDNKKIDGIVCDAIGGEFSKVLRKLGLKRRGSFYNLRHCFRTAADAAKDPPAIDHIMGHADASMGANYRHEIGDDRLKAVVNVVHAWLWPPVQTLQGSSDSA